MNTRPSRYLMFPSQSQKSLGRTGTDASTNDAATGITTALNTAKTSIRVVNKVPIHSQ